MIYGSVCSGIEAATVAWHPLGWKASFFSEIEKFPCAVLKHHYPDIPLHGDFTTIKENDYEPVNLLVGGTPCQSFSVAGLRKGMDDERGNLALEYLKLAQRLRAKWVVWENVPGVLSSNEGRDFGAFLGGLEELGYGWSYRTLDAQHFGVPQRRRRIFVVGYLGDWRPSVAVLFERESLLRHPAPSREKREGIAGATEGGIGDGSEAPLTARMVALGEYKCDGSASAIKARDYKDATDLIATCYENHPQDSRVKDCGDTAPTLKARAGTGGGNLPFVTIPIHDKATRHKGDSMKSKNPESGCREVDIAKTIDTSNQDPSKNQGGIAVAFQSSELRLSDKITLKDTAPTLKAETKKGDTECRVLNNMQVRRLTPTECERLQGFPDNYTRISWRGKDAEKCPDGPRYKALGNSMAVPVMRFIGERIQAVQEILDET